MQLDEGPCGMTGMVDLHSHHLPGVDDGPETLDASLEQVRRLGEAGYEVLVTTPHVIRGHYEHRRAGIETAVQVLQKAVGAAPRILPGAEHRFDEDFLDLLARGELVPLGGRGTVVLVEFAWPKLPANVLDILYRIQLKGYVPLMAHPDRYQNDEGDFARLRTWVERGGFLQVEIGSLVGRYGGAARAACRRLLAEGLAHVAAGDVHGPGDVELHVKPGLAALAQEIGEESALHLCRDNPLRILGGRA
jgi:protein-tyrosine phosphatase